jgi:CubicO group peptidase (beta-lactamase class C family)
MAPPRQTDFGAVETLLRDAVSDGKLPGAQALVTDRDGALWRFEIGVRRHGGAPVTADTRYDLASLTKVVATLSAVLALASEGELDLDDPVRRFIASAGWFQQPTLGDATVRQLLTHTSGLPNWTPIFARASNRLTALANALQTPIEHPPGTFIYSDIGFITLGAIVERVAGERLDRFVQTRLHGPLGMHATGFGPLDGVPVAATEHCGWRSRLLEGEVHDENAWALEGVAGHAGLFGTADDLARYARAWLRHDPLLAPETLLLEATREAVRDGDARRGLGWQLAAPQASSGARLSASAFGHTGFTGTSLWIDPERDLAFVLLSNRVHPHRERGADIDTLRPAFHAAAASAVDG